MAASYIEIDNVSIMFGSDTADAMALADQGKDREEIQEATGNVLGVHDCSVDIAEGEILVLMGLSGSGKSTLLRAINRLNPITRGTVRINADGNAHDVAAAGSEELRSIRGKLVSMVFQQFALLPWRSVADNVGLGLELAGIDKTERDEKVSEQLSLVGLAERADSLVGELSGGMQQRVGLARAFATGAPILLMDEPFSALDPLIRSRLQDELLDLQTRLKKTIIFVSHDLDEALKIGNRIAIMEGGRIVQCGTAQDILLSPANDYVADFVAHMNPLGVLCARDIMRPADGEADKSKPVAGSAKPDTPVRQLLAALAKTKGEIGVIDNGHIVGMIGSDDIVASIARYQAA
ncbi:MAG: choline ABC transporter ATP-binding protein [Rhizobiaceae bacterium]